MINAFQHVPTGAIVQFPNPPLRGNPDEQKLRQSTGFDSDGNIYVYHRNAVKQRDVKLIFAQIGEIALDALLVFVQSRNGDKLPFNWYDHLAAVHVVRFTTGGVKFTETTFGRYRVEIQITEET